MSSNTQETAPSATQPAITLSGVGKSYRLYERPKDRLLELLPGFGHRGRTHTALAPLDLKIGHGEVIGLIGRNGAGKSTLLQLICGTLTPSSGQLKVDGRIAALLELGSGFNPEFTGRENVFLNGAILGLSKTQVAARFDEIHAFSEIGEAIDQPVKTYSSGMFVRLAFAVAVCVEPDILVIDEALSVGDGAFARKSFDRIMALKAQGKTILFCSHSLYQVEAICNRALWLNQGQVMAEGAPAQVIEQYERFLYAEEHGHSHAQAPTSTPTLTGAQQPPRFTRVAITLDEQPATLSQVPEGQTGHSELCIQAYWQGPADWPAPSFAMTLMGSDGRMIASAGTHIDRISPQHDAASGEGQIEIRLPALSLLKGEYWVEVYLMCENGIMFYDQQIPAAHFTMSSPERMLEQGLVHLPRRWSALDPALPDMTVE